MLHKIIFNKYINFDKNNLSKELIINLSLDYQFLTIYISLLCIVYENNMSFKDKLIKIKQEPISFDKIFKNKNKNKENLNLSIDQKLNQLELELNNLDLKVESLNQEAKEKLKSGDRMGQKEF